MNNRVYNSTFSSDIYKNSMSDNESQVVAMVFTPLKMAEDSRKHHPTVVYPVCLNLPHSHQMHSVMEILFNRLKMTNQ